LLTPWNGAITEWVSQNIRSWYSQIPVYIEKSGKSGESAPNEKYGATPGARTYNYDIQDGRCVMIAWSGISTDEWFEWQVYHGIFSL